MSARSQALTVAATQMALPFVVVLVNVTLELLTKAGVQDGSLPGQTGDV